jgi:hypothetical protein
MIVYTITYECSRVEVVVMGKTFNQQSLRHAFMHSPIHYKNCFPWMDPLTHSLTYPYSGRRGASQTSSLPPVFLYMEGNHIWKKKNKTYQTLTPKIRVITLTDKSLFSYQRSILYVQRHRRRAPGSVVGWGTILQVGRSQVRFPRRSLDFSIDLILPTVLWPLWSTQPVTEMSIRNLLGG